MKFDGYLLEFPGLTQTLTWPNGEFEGANAVHVIADVVAAFAPLLRPLSIDVLLWACRRDTQAQVDLVHPFWFAATTATQADPHVGPSTSRSVCRRVEAITPATIKALISEAVALEKLDPEVVWTCEEIRIYTVEIRLPDVFADRDALSLAVTRGDVGAKIERRTDGAWIYSPRSPGDEAPLEVTMTGGDSVPTLNIITHWSLWAPGGPGEPDLNAVIDALVAQGWVRCGS